MEAKLKIGIVGLGLIGGSIEKRLLQEPDKFEVLSVSVSQGREYKFEDLHNVDILFLCGPQTSIPKQLEKIALLISKSGQEGTIPPEERAFAKTIITDVASTKRQITEKAKELGLTNFIPGHPMAGTEHQGYEASFPELFENANWVLGESNVQTAKLEKLITETFKARLVILDAETHDRCVALVSHLPLLLSLGLSESVSAYPQAQKVIGPGFKSMTRLANGNPELGREIIGLNKSNIKAAWDFFKEEIDRLLTIKGETLEFELVDIKEKLQALVA